MKKYKYINPEDKGYIRLKLKKSEIKKLVRRYNKFVKYEIYEDDKTYLIHEFDVWWIKVLNIVLYPLLLLYAGLSDFKQVNIELYNSIFDKKTGRFVSRVIYKDKIKQDSINKTLDLIK